MPVVGIGTSSVVADERRDRPHDRAVPVGQARPREDREVRDQDREVRERQEHEERDRPPDGGAGVERPPLGPRGSRGRSRTRRPAPSPSRGRATGARSRPGPTRTPPARATRTAATRFGRRTRTPPSTGTASTRACRRTGRLIARIEAETAIASESPPAVAAIRPSPSFRRNQNSPRPARIGFRTISARSPPPHPNSHDEAIVGSESHPLCGSAANQVPDISNGFHSGT